MKKFFITVIVLILSIAAIIGAGWYTFNKMNHSKGGTAHIFAGASAKQISEILEDEGIIKDGDIFYVYVKAKIYYEKYVSKNFKEENYAFKQGDFKFKKGDFDSIIQLLVKGENNPQSINVTFPEGITVKEIADILEKNKVIKSADFLNYVRNQDNYLQFKGKYPWLPIPKPGVTEFFEGYLHTTTYKLPKKKQDFQVDANYIVDKMLTETNRWYTNFQSDIENQHYTFADLLTLASIIEKEASYNEDRKKISQVFYNRMKIGMKLQSDMTAAYATGKHKVFLYNSDIAIESPYNTYFVPGLPIGPISSPSESAFLAALHPYGDEFQDLFFYARPNGETLFAQTIAQHEQNVQLYEHEWKELEAKQQNGQ